MGDIVVSTIRGVRDTVVAPAVDAVAGGVDVLIVSRVERAVEQARSRSPGRGSPPASDSRPADVQRDARGQDRQ